MNKVVENGQVAVLYSPGFGAGWYTWNEARFEDESDALELVFDPTIVSLVRQRRSEEHTSEPPVTSLSRMPSSA